MSVLTRTWFWLFCLVVGLDLVLASSAPPRPLKRIAHPNTLSLEILPRRPSASGSFGKRSYPINSSVLQHTDTFRLRLSAFGDTFNLHLRPNEHLIHPAARINHYKLGPNGQSVLSHSEPIVPGSVKAYWGEVVPTQFSADRLRLDAAGAYPRPSGKSELGWARIVVHHQGDVAQGVPPSFEGAFSANGIVHHVMTKDNYFRHKHALDPYVVVEDDPDSSLVIFRDSDLMSETEYHDALKSLDGAVIPPPRGAKTCAHDNLAYNTDPKLNPVLRKPPPVTPWYDPLGLLAPPFARGNLSLSKRDDVMGGGSGSNFQSNIGQSTGCPTTQKIVYMGVAADCVYTSSYGSTQNATQQIITNFNTASALYKSTFNVSLGIVELEVHDPECPTTADPATPWNIGCQDNITLNDRLSMFSDWRGKKGNDNAGLWHLMSGCPTGTEVGIAWLGTLCTQTSSGSAPNIVSGTAVSTSGRVEWQVVAHEIGHNFGAIHDCTDGCPGGPTCCPLTASTCNANSQFIMSPVAESSEQKFSQCTLGNICSLMQPGASGATNTTCLIDAASAKDLISLGMCGNGIVEAGEECDPGKGVNSACCDSTTCKLKSGAVCDPDSSACCTQQCSFAPATQVCRPAKDASCDMAEMCTGNSSACPADITAPNGKSCGGDGLACASGVCTSLDKQCQTVGASMSLQKACPSRNDKSCQVSCQDPTTSNQCVVLQSPLVDGSPCGYGGMCNKGQCQSGSLLDTAKAWYTQNLQISIPVTIAAAFVIFIIAYLIFSAIRSCCMGSERRNFPSKAAGRQRLQSWPNLPPGATMVQVQPGGPPPYMYGPNVPAHGRMGSNGSWNGNVPPSTNHRPTRSTGSASSQPFRP